MFNATLKVNIADTNVGETADWKVCATASGAARSIDMSAALHSFKKWQTQTD